MSKTNSNANCALSIIIALLSFTISICVPEVRCFIGLDDCSKKENEKNDTPTTVTTKNSSDVLEEKPNNADKKNEPKRIKEEDLETKPALSIALNIYDSQTGKKDLKFERYLMGIIQELEFFKIKITGNKSVEIRPNKTIANQYSASIELNISVDDKIISLPTLYGRGDSEKQAINHALSMSKDLIKNKIKQTQ